MPDITKGMKDTGINDIDTRIRSPSDKNELSTSLYAPYPSSASNYPTPSSNSYQISGQPSWYGTARRENDGRKKFYSNGATKNSPKPKRRHGTSRINEHDDEENENRNDRPDTHSPLRNPVETQVVSGQGEQSYAESSNPPPRWDRSRRVSYAPSATMSQAWYTVLYSITWEAPSFLNSLCSADESIGLVLTITGDPITAQATSFDTYLSTNWPSLRSCLLEVIDYCRSISSKRPGE